MRTLLFAPETFNLAETTRMIEVAKQCRHEAHCIFMGYSEVFSHYIDQAGFTFHLLTPHLTEEQIVQIMDFDQGRTRKIPFSYEMLKERIDNELALIDTLQPAGIVIGSTISLLISARAAHIPLTYVKPYAYSRAWFEDNQFMQQAPAFIRQTVQKFVLNFKWLPRDIKKLINEYGVAQHFPTFIDALDADLNCITTPEILTGNPKLPQNSLYVGPIFADLPEDIPDSLTQLLREQTEPVIFCSMGSSANRDIIIRLLNNFEGLPVQVISPMNSYLSEAERAAVPNNVHLYDWLPAKAVQAAVTASVLHGGEGTIQTACVTGKPFIGIGLQKEQEYNIRCCVNYGNALQLSQKQLSNQQLFKETLHELLENDAYKHRGELLKKELEGMNGSKLAAELILKQTALQ